jgi:DNA-binding LacI/PurR family transcriptional regulator
MDQADLIINSHAPGQDVVRGEIIRSIVSKRLKPGDRVQSIRDLSKLCQVATITVNKALIQLRDEKILIGKNRQGYFITPNALRILENNNSSHLVNVCIIQKREIDPFNAFYSQLQHKLLAGLSHLDSCFEFRVWHVFDDMEFRRIIASRKIDFVIIFGLHLERELLRILADKNIHILCLEHEQYDLDPIISWNEEGGARELAIYLAGLGHRNFGWVVPEHKSRLLGFKAGLKMAGVEDAEIQTFNIKSTSKKNVERLIRDLIVSKDMPTAMVFFYDSMAAQAAKLFLEFDIAVPESISIASFGDTPLAELTTPTLTSIGFDWNEFTEASLAALKYWITEDCMPKPVVIDAKLRIRGSCAPAQ